MAESKGVEPDDSTGKVLGKLKKEHQGVVYLLKFALENPSGIVEGEPGVLEAKEKISGELEALGRADSALTGLIVDIDPDDNSYFGQS